LVVAKGSKGLFPVRVREQIAGNPALVAIIEPLLAVWHAIRDQMAILDRQMLARARNDQVTRQLITIPGVGVVIALAYTYTAVIDDPARFRRSVSVGAYLGLTPGVTSPVRSTPLGTSRNAGTACYADISTKPPPCSYRDSRASVLKSWGLGLAKRIGMRRAKVAVARKLAVIMHRILERSERIPLDGDTIDYRLRAIPKGNSFFEIRRL
jgi:transposase